MKMMYWGLVLGITLLVSGCNVNQSQDKKTNDTSVVESETELPSRLENLSKDWKTDWSKHTIPYEEIISGGPPRDGIPSIDDPKFLSVKEARDWLAPTEPVMVVDINKDARAYPLQILIWHEIVNDTVGGRPILVSYCPLCNSAIVFDRQIKNRTFEFGTSGLLVNSDLVMYDRTTETLWQQLTGEAIVGDLVGEKLKMLNSNLVSFNDFTSAHPDGKILSRVTGYDRKYGHNPYPGYDGRQESYFQTGQDLGRLPAMERVVSISMNGIDRAYPYSLLKEKKVVNDKIGNQEVVIFYKKGTNSALDSQVIANAEDVGSSGAFDPSVDGKELRFELKNGEIVDQQTHSTWNILGQSTSGPLKGKQLKDVVHGDHFWFSWVAFKPETTIYSVE
ncbi:DUF3179 domain-containing protein [Halobacillus yeomjeoni]|uniref:DUF3179 domain-containing protein n=1 Tax=Halobacillus yeomjeoni TaxID=311194 RepID=A0A931MWM9_9BACI|nr:DUF3179 domain-containing protein [Halobacillus yeomjeoni]MBH0231717.1 DUF3179 domain-containing protein [Halobacillus yeomjeoni]